MGTLIVRPIEESDADHVVSSWLHSYARSDDAVELARLGARHPQLQVYAKLLDVRPTKRGPSLLRYSLHRMLIERLLALSTTKVACLDDDPDIIVGWACHQGDVLHYVCVVPDFQRCGAAKLLLDSVGRLSVATHWTDAAQEGRLDRWVDPGTPTQRMERLKKCLP